MWHVRNTIYILCSTHFVDRVELSCVLILAFVSYHAIEMTLSFIIIIILSNFNTYSVEITEASREFAIK